MNAVITILITLLGKIVPAIGANADLINTIITALEQIVPVLIQEYKDLVPEVQNIVAALKGTDGITTDQWNALDALEGQIDAEFGQAAKDEGL
jgi:hypothetical protein